MVHNGILLESVTTKSNNVLLFNLPRRTQLGIIMIIHDVKTLGLAAYHLPWRDKAQTPGFGISSLTINIDADAQLKSHETLDTRLSSRPYPN